MVCSELWSHRFARLTQGPKILLDLRGLFLKDSGVVVAPPSGEGQGWEEPRAQRRSAHLQPPAETQEARGSQGWATHLPRKHLGTVLSFLRRSLIRFTFLFIIMW